MRSIRNASFQLQSGGRTERGSAGVRTLVGLAEGEPISDSIPSVQRKSWSLKMTVQEAVAFLFQQKEDLGAACSRSSQVSGIVSSTRAIELIGYRYNAVDGLPKS